MTEDQISGIARVAAKSINAKIESLLLKYNADLEKGGAGSGNFGHSGRTGEVGGSSGGGSTAIAPETPAERLRVEQWHQSMRQEVTARELEHKLHTESGFTHPQPKSGYVVGIKGHGQIIEGYASHNDLQHFMSRNPGSIGAWHSEGKTYLDVVSVVHSREDAIALGQKNDQIAIWDVQAGAEIQTGGTGAVKSATLNKYAPEDWEAEWIAEDNGDNGPCPGCQDAADGGPYDNPYDVPDPSEVCFSMNGVGKNEGECNCTLIINGVDDEEMDAIDFDPTAYDESEKAALLKGGAGSGNYGHAGRPGEVGGSGEGGGSEHVAAYNQMTPDQQFAHVKEHDPDYGTEKGMREVFDKFREQYQDNHADTHDPKHVMADTHRIIEVSAHHAEGKPLGFVFRGRTETQASAQTHVDKFPKGTKFSAGSISGRLGAHTGFFGYDSKLYPDKTMGAKNETAIKRYQSTMKAIEKLGYKVQWTTPYGNSYATQAEFENALKDYSTTKAAVAQTIPIAVQIAQSSLLSKSEQKLSRTIERLRPLRKERAVVINAKGMVVWEKDGGHDFVPLKGLESKDLEGATFLHNHPSGVAPSVDDIGSACALRLARLYAIGKTGYTYCVEPPEGHDTFEPEMWPDIDRAGRAADDAIREEYAKMLKADEVDPDEANIEHWNVVNEAIAEATGIKYTRTGQGHYDLPQIKAEHPSHIPVYDKDGVSPAYPTSKKLSAEANATFSSLYEKQKEQL